MKKLLSNDTDIGKNGGKKVFIFRELRHCVASVILIFALSHAGLSQTKVNENSFTFDNGTITHFRLGSISIKKTLKPSKIEFSGRPHIKIENPKTGATYDIDTDSALGDKLNSSKERNSAVIELKGHVEYTFRQPGKNGIKTVRGTADNGLYRQATQEIILHKVKSELSDPGQLTPDILRADRATIDLNTKPYTYHFVGDANGNDIRFTPPPPLSKPGDKPAKNLVKGAIHLYGFANGTFQPGEITIFNGEGTSVEFTDETDGSEVSLIAKHFQADYASDSKTVAKMEVWNGLRYHLKRPAPALKPNEEPKRGEQELTGSGEKISYDLAGKTMILTGGIDATLKESLQLLEPAHLKATRLSVSTEGSAKYLLTGGGAFSLLEFRPHPPKPNKIEEQRSQPTEELDREPDSLDRPEATPGAKASAGPSQTFLTGSIRLSGFQNAEFEPGRGVLCEAPPNENLQLDTKEETTFSISKVTTHLFQAYLSAEGGLVSATTRGALKFFVQQKKAQPTKKLASGLKPVSSQAAKPALLVLQSFAGSAANLLEQNSALR